MFGDATYGMNFYYDEKNAGFKLILIKSFWFVDLQKFFDLRIQSKKFWHEYLSILIGLWVGKSFGFLPDVEQNIYSKGKFDWKVNKIQYNTR